VLAEMTAERLLKRILFGYVGVSNKEKKTTQLSNAADHVFSGAPAVKI
jgi:hypothetical protein